MNNHDGVASLFIGTFLFFLLVKIDHPSHENWTRLVEFALQE